MILGPLSTDRRSLSFAWLIVLCCALLTRSVLAADYYVSRSTGNDSFKGTSPERAWKTFVPVKGIPIGPGDRLLLKRGDMWSTQLTVHGRGTKDQPCVLGAYGVGALPRIQRGGKRTDICVSMRDPQGCHISDLHLQGAGVGLSLFYQNSFDNEHIVIKDMVLEDIDFGGHLKNGQADNNAWDAGICISGTLGEKDKGRTVVRDVTIRNIALKNVCNGFNVGFGNCQEFLTTELIRDLRIDNVDSFGGRSCGVHVRCTTDALITNCDAFDCGKKVKVGTCSAFVHDSKDVVWQDCELGYTAAPGSPDGIAFDFEGRNERVVLRRSLLHDSASSAILFYNGFFKAQGVNRDCIVDDCVIFNDAKGPVRFYGGSLLFRHCRIYVASKKLKDQFLSLANSNKGVRLEECAVSLIGEEDNGPNLAEKARVSVSSSAIKADVLRDGDTETFWQPASDRIKGSWIELGFPEKTRVNKLSINERTSEIARFAVRYWDEESSTWRDAFNGKQVSGNRRFIPIVPILTTRLRFVVLETKAAAPQVSEMNVHCIAYNWDKPRSDMRPDAGSEKNPAEPVNPLK